MGNTVIARMGDCAGGHSGRKKGHPRHKGAGRTREEIEARFWSKVIKTDGCWWWNARKLDAGYGMFHMGETMKVAHRVAYELMIGKIPDGMFACHKCDNPSCVNPEHLFIGTHKDNMHDRMLKGGFKMCGGNNTRRLSESAKEEIRNTQIVRGVISQLARKFNVARVTIRRVLAEKVAA